MRSPVANGDPHLLLWRHVRAFAVPTSMIQSATVRRCAGDWAGACAAARIDVDLNLRTVARTSGHDVAHRIRADLRHLAPELLRWHMPRMAPDGLLRPDLTVSLARYGMSEDNHPIHLVARTAPAWADAGQRISLALWDESRPDAGSCVYPHPRPDRRFRLDLHRHLWDARRAGELRERSGADAWSPADQNLPDVVREGSALAVHRWAAEAAALLRAQGRADGGVVVRLGGRRRLTVNIDPARGAGGPPAMRITVPPATGSLSGWPVLPDAATWVLPDLRLLHAGLIDVDQLHPLVASALVPGHVPLGAARVPDGARDPRLVDCRGTRHRIGLVKGVLAPLDHEPAEIRREELLAALGGPPLPCLRVIEQAHRHPDLLVGIRSLLDHGDVAGALDAVEDLLGPEALLRNGALRDELETAASRQITYGLFRAGLTGRGPAQSPDQRQARRRVRTHPRHTTAR